MTDKNTKVWRNFIIRNWRNKEYSTWAFGITVTEWAITFNLGWMDILFALPKFFRHEK